MNKSFNQNSKKSKSANKSAASNHEERCPELFCGQCGSESHDILDCELFYEEMTGCK